MKQRRSKKVRDMAPETMNDDDQISRLPEAVIHKIFSFIDTKFMVQSSVLSRRWIDTWKSHPRLKFDIDRSINCTGSSRLPNFVHRFLSKRDNSVEVSIIDVCFKSIKLPLLKEILMYAMSHRTQNLKVEFVGQGPTRRGGFDLSIFRSPFLQHISLNIDLVVLKTPPVTWDLRALTTLNLQGVKFTLHPSNDGASKSLELFSCMPNLKTLALVACKLLNIDCFIIKSNGLENLTMRDINQICDFVISAPKLSSFTYYGMCRFPLSANDLHSLETVELHLTYRRYHDTQEERVELMIDTLYQLRKAKFLTINFTFLSFLSGFPKLLIRRPCPFERLQRLTLFKCRRPPLSFSYDHVITYLTSSSPDVMVINLDDPSPSISRNQCFYICNMKI